MTHPTEMKVEVIFGRAYIVQVADGSGEERERCGGGHIITRNDTHGHIIKLYDGGFKHVSGLPKPNCSLLMSLVDSRAYVDCVICRRRHLTPLVTSGSSPKDTWSRHAILLRVLPRLLGLMQ